MSLAPTLSGRLRLVDTVTAGVLLLAAVLSIGNLMYWAVGAVHAPLFWDDAAVVFCSRELLTKPVDPSLWNYVMWAHPPTAFLAHAAFLHWWPASFVECAHTYQILMVAALCRIAWISGRAAEGASAATTILGVFSAWPIVPAVARQVQTDLPVATLCFAALAGLVFGYRRLGIVAFAWACCLKLTAVGFLPALLWASLRGRANSERSMGLVLVTLSWIPFGWIAYNMLEGRVNGDAARVLSGSVLPLLKFWAASALRHGLEMFVYDGRWLISSSVAAAIASLYGTARWPLRGPLLGRSTGDVMLQCCALAVGGVLVVAIVFGGLSLQRYLMPLALPIAWIIATVVWRSGSRVAWALLALGILHGVVSAHDAAGLLGGYEERIAAWKPGLGRGIDSRPETMRDFVQAHVDAITLLRRVGGDKLIAADWPASMALTDPDFGYVRQPFRVRSWKPGEPMDGIDVLWVYPWAGPAPSFSHTWRAEFGRRYPSLLLGR